MTSNSLPKIKYNLFVDKYCNLIIYHDNNDDNERDAAFKKLNVLTSLIDNNNNKIKQRLKMLNNLPNEETNLDKVLDNW